MEYALLCMTGLSAGVLGGLLGIGGSTIILPAMIWILGRSDAAGNEQIHQYMAAAMIVNFLLIVPSIIPHLRKKAVWAGVWKYLAAAALVGVLVGVLLGSSFKGPASAYLRYVLGGFFVYVVVHNVYRIFRGRRTEGQPRGKVEALPAWRKMIVGFPMGVVAGLLGIGGGSLAVPSEQIILKMPLRNAIATSAATIASISWLGAIAKNVAIHYQGDGSPMRSVVLAACLAPAAMTGSFIGGHLTHALPLRVVRAVFVVIMALGALKVFGLIR